MEATKQCKQWVQILMDAGADLHLAVHVACWGENPAYERSKSLESAHYEPAVKSLRSLLQEGASGSAVKEATTRLLDIIENPVFYANAACAPSTRRPT